MKCTGVWHRAKCTRCGNTDPTYHTGYDEHDMKVSSSKAATCTSSGYKTYTCSHGCGYSYTETLSALGHNMTSSTSCSGTATCVSYRVCTTRHYCTRSGCSYAYSDYPSQSKDSSNHVGGTYSQDTKIPINSPNVTSQGGNIYTAIYCKSCNKQLEGYWHY